MYTSICTWAVPLKYFPLPLYRSINAYDCQIYETTFGYQQTKGKVPLLQLTGTGRKYLEGNLKKYQTMNIFRKGVKEHNTHVINIKGTDISLSSSLKLTVDDKLCFSEH